MFDAMSDAQVSAKVAEFEGWDIKPEFMMPDGSVLILDGATGRYFNPCNNWAHAGPIIQKNEISLIRDTSTNDVWEAIQKGWHTTGGFVSRSGEGFHSINANPLRAAMICFLKMKGLSTLPHPFCRTLGAEDDNMRKL